MDDILKALNSSENDENIYMPSHEKTAKTKSRPPRKRPPRKNILATLNLDDLMDGIEIEPKIKETVKSEVVEKKVQINSDKTGDKIIIPETRNVARTNNSLSKFEENILNYFDIISKDLKTVFISELKFNLEDILDYDHQTNRFLIDLQKEIQVIIDDQANIYFSHQNVINSEQNDLGFYFNELSSFLKIRQQTLNGENIKDEACHQSDLLFSSNKYIETITPLLNQIKSEKMLFKQTDCVYSSSEKLHTKLWELQTRSFQAEKIVECLDKSINEVKKKQTVLRERYHDLTSFSSNINNASYGDDDNTIKYDDIHQNIDDLIEFLKLKHTYLIGDKFSKIKRQYKDIDESIKNHLIELQIRLNRIQTILPLQCTSESASDHQNITCLPSSSFSQNQQFSHSQTTSFCNGFGNENKSQFDSFINHPNKKVYFDESFDQEVNRRPKQKKPFIKSTNPSLNNDFESDNELVKNVRNRLKSIQRMRKENNIMLSNI